MHDFLIEYGGAERVLEALHEIWPKAPVYTAFFDSKSLGVNASKFKSWKIITSWGSKLPFSSKLASPYRILAKSFFESFDLSGFDIVISSSNMYFAKAVRVPNGVHICYCHTPPRSLWGYRTARDWQKNPITKFYGLVINHFMRVWDFEVSQKPDDEFWGERGGPASTRGDSSTRGRVDFFIANSSEVAARIKKFYRRDSKVIYPPVDVKSFARKTTKAKRLRQEKTLDVSRSSLSNYFLTVSRLASVKNIDLIVEVCVKLGLTLKVIGAGGELENLKKLAHSRSGTESTVQFLGEVSDKVLIDLYQNCKAVIFAANDEDFGLVPVEAMAAGKPVIALAEGGVFESVVDGKTGVYFSPATSGSLTLAINNFVDLEKRGYFDPEFISKHAQKFSKERFKREVLKFVYRALTKQQITV